ncbi:DMT family transporter [Phenylobacterium immobile]|uniref:DMT family transporter n=1 Tax=Phenylobacterium immobile TaxID=21 RepID=UPI000B21BA23|nr:DMT family transporter [Phenylobacterium immobile]
MLWILLTVAAAPLLVARNAMQRTIAGDGGPWGATLVRFLFGLPLALVIFGAVALLTPDATPHVSPKFFMTVSAGAMAQMCATAFLLASMRRSGFAVATMVQQCALPLSAIIGWLALGDNLSLQGWMGIALATLGVTVLSWPKADAAKGSTLGIAFGVGAGFCFAVSLNAFRQAGLSLDPAHPIYAGSASVCVAQAVQSIVLGGALAILRPHVLIAVVKAWRPSLFAGLFGSLASACWFAALTMAPAGAVRAVGVIETPIAAAAGHRLFRERLSLRQMIGGLLTAAGVVATALG